MTQVQTPLNRLAVASGETLAWGVRTYVIGIINLTPDSFSGDGLGGDVYRAVDLALRFQDEGADILDIGAESTRPGHKQVSLDEELARLMPALEAVAKRVDLPISVDTYKAAVARRAVEAAEQFLPRLAVTAHQADTHLEVLLDRLLAQVQHPAAAGTVDGDGLLHEDVLALLDRLGKVDRPKARGRRQDHHVGHADGFFVGIETDELILLFHVCFQAVIFL